MLTLRQILEDYNSQLSHLAKEMEQIQRDWTKWEQSKPAGIMSGIGR